MSVWLRNQHRQLTRPLVWCRRVWRRVQLVVKHGREEDGAAAGV
jgi:hypothetical protein